MPGQQVGVNQGQQMNMMAGGMHNGGMMMQAANLGMMGGGAGLTSVSVSYKFTFYGQPHRYL